MLERAMEKKRDLCDRKVNTKGVRKFRIYTCIAILYLNMVESYYIASSCQGKNDFN